MRTAGSRAFFLAAMCAVFCLSSAFADFPALICVTRTWSGGGDGRNWSDPANWDPSGVPGEHDELTVGAGKSVLLCESTPELDSLTLYGTLTFTNWMTRLNADAVSVKNGGVITCIGPFKENAMSNRVWIACRNLEVEQGGAIHADKRGYAALNGPGLKNITNRKAYNGGAYGGSAPGSAVVYGSMTEPTDPGTGGCGQQNTASTNGENAGGGAIRIEATEDVKVDGRISADGSPVVTWKASAGSGGSVCIFCRAVKGAGRVSASSTDYPRSSNQNSQFQGGSGGRIAVLYSPAAQSAYDDSGCTVGFYASGSVGHYATDYTPLTAEGYMGNSGMRPQNLGGVGTLYFPDNRFLTNAAYASAGRRFAGEWHSADASDGVDVPGSFNLDGRIDLSKQFRRLSVAGSMSVNAAHSAGAGLILSNMTTTVAGNCTLTGGRIDMRGGKFTVGGNLLMTSSNETASESGALMVVRAVATNSVETYGVQVEVGGKWTMEHKSAVYPYCHGSRGSVPYFHVKSFEICSNAVIEGCMKGYSKQTGPGYAYEGVSHGGKGGAMPAKMSTLKPPYGSREHPVTPGSGGGGTNARAGGGVVIVHADGQMKVNGRINVQGQCANVDWASGSSAGSVYLRARKFSSETGRINAKGGRGDGSSGKQGTGSGGRVAIWAQQFGTTNISINVEGGTCRIDGQTPAEPGTIYWGVIDPKQGLLIYVK
ncbi:MAG: G8 domain-containing protein [Kiritimatiellae bacterium]|nr:G8 domain-containing protein [Kiritimatiellia bacterium]